MMVRRLQYLLFGLIATLVVGTGSAQAGYVSPDFFVTETAPSVTSAADMGATSQPREGKDRPSQDERGEHEQFTAHTPGGGSMSGHPDAGGQGSSQFAVVGSFPDPVSELVMYLLRESDARLPVPYLDGIMRPPRRAEHAAV